MRAIVTGPGKGKRPAALSLGGKTLAANRDGSFNLTTSNLVELFRKGYRVEPVRQKVKRIVTRRSTEPSVPARFYYDRGA